MSDEVHYVYITKYALTAGIERKPVKIYPDGRAYEVDRRFWGYTPTEYFHTREEAVADAKKRQAKKLASLQKQIDALSKKTFD